MSQHTMQSVMQALEAIGGPVLTSNQCQAFAAHLNSHKPAAQVETQLPLVLASRFLLTRLAGFCKHHNAEILRAELMQVLENPAAAVAALPVGAVACKGALALSSGCGKCYRCQAEQVGQALEPPVFMWANLIGDTITDSVKQHNLSKGGAPAAIAAHYTIPLYRDLAPAPKMTGADENTAFEAWRKEQMTSLVRMGYPAAAQSFRDLGSVQWAGWQARAELAGPALQ